MGHSLLARSRHRPRQRGHCAPDRQAPAPGQRHQLDPPPPARPQGVRRLFARQQHGLAPPRPRPQLGEPPAHQAQPRGDPSSQVRESCTLLTLGLSFRRRSPSRAASSLSASRTRRAKSTSACSSTTPSSPSPFPAVARRVLRTDTARSMPLSPRRALPSRSPASGTRCAMAL